MSTGHAYYPDEIRISYDALGVYFLKYPSGTRFKSFNEMLGALDLSFDHDNDRVSLRDRNLKPVTVERPGGRSFVRLAFFHGEVRFYDVCGLRINSKDVEANLSRCLAERTARQRGVSCRLRWYWDPTSFRRGPVPMTGYRGGRGGSFKGPAIFQEQKDTDFMRYDEDCMVHGLRPRARRRSHLPDHLWWDNWCRDQGEDRSWKRHRRKQWKD